MKICVSVKELLELARNCLHAGGCCDCALEGLCTEYEDLEKLCRIENVEPEITTKANDVPLMIDSGWEPVTKENTGSQIENTSVSSPKIGGAERTVDEMVDDILAASDGKGKRPSNNKEAAETGMARRLIEDVVNQSARKIVKVALDDGAIMPTYAHPGWDAGMDLYAREDAMVYRWGRRAFDTGVHIQIQKGYAGIVTGKSGLDHKSGITCHGLVDAGYTGSVRVNLYNCSEVDYPVKAGDKIAQLVIVPVLTPELVLVEEIDGSERGDAGFGSTGR